jgi:Lar family restriction alleviation protein
MTTKLLPCPFCGGRAKWSDGEQKTKYGNEQVYCADCYASAAPEATKAEAAEQWNSRVPHIHITAKGRWR